MSPEDPPPRSDAVDEGSPGLAKTVLRGAGLAGGGYALAQALNLAVYVVLARLLEPSEFGQYAAATVLVGFGVLLTESGMQSALIQRQDRLEEAQSTAVAATLVGGVLAALAALAAAPLLGLIFDSGDVTELAAAASGLVLINVLAVTPNSILQRRFSFLRMVVVDPVEVVVFGTVAIIGAANGLGAWALIIGQYAGFLSSTSLSWAFARWRPKLRLMSFAMWRELVDYGRHIFLATGILRLGDQATDTLVIGRGIGTAALGQYRFAFRIASLPFTVLLAGAAYVIFPAMSRIAADEKRLKAAFLRSLRWMAALGFPAGLILVPLGPSLAVLVFGDVWLAAGYAAMAMCAYTGASCVSSAISELLKAAANPEPLVRMHIVTALATAGPMLALVPLGLSAAAAGASIGALVGAGYAIRVAGRVQSISSSLMLREIWPPAVAGSIMALLLLPLDRLVLEPAEHGTLVGLGLVGLEAALGALLYLVLLRVLAPQTSRELLLTLRSRGAG